MSTTTTSPDTAPQKIIIAFDLYGTLVSTESIAKELAVHFGEERGREVAANWRRYQLEYTWRLNSMSKYKPFNLVTLSSLHHALAIPGATTTPLKPLSPPEITNLMHAYDSLSLFPDVEPALKHLQSSSSSTTSSQSLPISTYIFSNGTPAMLSTTLSKSQGLAPYAHLFKLVSAEDVKAYKPAPKTYHHLASSIGRSPPFTPDVMSDIWLVSGNPFDVVGARATGMQAAWVDREGKGWVDALGDLVGDQEGNCRPTIIVKGVDEAVFGIEKWTKEKRSLVSN